MKYRAVAVGLEKDGHPVQVVGMTIGPIIEWAAHVAKTELVPVEVFISEERLLSRHVPPPVPAESLCLT